VDAKDFLDPCKAIATLQIARDLRNDSAVQLSSLLENLPADIKEMCEQAEKETTQEGGDGKPYEVPADKARDLSLRTSEKLLDLDLEEQLGNIHTFAEIVQKQREARLQLIYLLIRSRCKFGSMEAGESFYNLDKTAAELKERKETLLDAMALEGLDFEETKEDEAEKAKKEKAQELAPLAWYLEEQAKKEKDEGAEEPDAKRAKVEAAPSEV